MRLRNIPGVDEAVAASPYCIRQPEQRKGAWDSVFQNHNPIHIEIGMGKGQFILKLAQRNPEVNYIGIEKYTSVLLRAIQKLNGLEPGAAPANLYFICMNAENLADVFKNAEISRIYLNFSDPWPKERHAQRRLTSEKFLALYDKILTPDGTIEFKTDNKNLFDFSLKEIPKAGWRINAFTRDLHHDADMIQGNIMTEYEEKFSSAGNPIYKLIASR